MSSYFYLSILGGHEETLKKVVVDNREELFAVDEQGDPTDYYKWENHEGVLLGISEDYPDLVFKLQVDDIGEGEEWVEYYKNGKIQIAESAITFEDFDESKLA